MTKRVFYFSLFSFLLVGFYAQSRQKEFKKIHKRDFYDGFYKTLSGKKVGAKLTYDAGTNILFEKISKKEVIPHYSHSINYFEIFEEDEKRVFYSIPYDINNAGMQNNVFFEVLFEKANVAVLRYYFVKRQDPKLVPTIGGNSYLTNQNNDLTIDKIFLVQEKEGIKEYLRHGKTWMAGYKIVDKTLVDDFFGIYWEEVRSFMKENKLMLKEPDDLVQAVEHYTRIRN